MKKMFLIGLLAAFGLCSYAQTQNSASEMMQQAQESLDKQSYIKARYLFYRPTTPLPRKVTTSRQ